MKYRVKRNQCQDLTHQPNQHSRSGQKKKGLNEIQQADRVNPDTNQSTCPHYPPNSQDSHAVSSPLHVTLFRPALSFLSGRCGRASQHKVFRNTTSFLDWPLFNTLLAATNTEFPLVTSDTVSRPLPEHSTTQTSHNNPHVCRPHRNGTPSLLSERHNAARNTRTCGIMTRHAPPVMTRK